MKLDQIINKDDLQSTQIEHLKQQKKEYKHIGALRKVAGHTLFSFNCETKEIKPATFTKKASIGFDGTPKYEERVDIEPNCYYEQALNKKNFIKRLKRSGKTLN